MEKMLRVGCMVLMILSFLSFEVSAGDPGNGFLSGPHYNLNIIGKNADFVCPDEVDPLTGLYGNVIFAPEYTGDSSYKILMKSGKMATYTELKAVDNCAFREGEEPVGQALIELPKSDLGYYVFARVLAKPGKDEEQRTITIFDPALALVQDEFGNDLLYLGLVTNSGFQSTTQPFTRSTGKSKAVDITPLFWWTGNICYLTPPDGSSIIPTAMSLCAQDADNDGIPDDTDLNRIPDVLQPSLPDTLTCPTGFVTVALDTYCVSYTEEDDQWVFNIADFVDYFWNVTNQGVKLLQVRFYPITQ